MSIAGTQAVMSRDINISECKRLQKHALLVIVRCQLTNGKTEEVMKITRDCRVSVDVNTIPTLSLPLFRRAIDDPLTYEKVHHRIILDNPRDRGKFDNRAVKNRASQVYQGLRMYSATRFSLIASNHEKAFALSALS